MSRTLHLFGTDWGAMMVPIQVIRWYRMQCYDGTDSCAIVVPIRRYCHIINAKAKDSQPGEQHYFPALKETKVYELGEALMERIGKNSWQDFINKNI